MIEYENYHCHTMYSNCLTQPDSTMFIADYAKVYRQRGQRVLCISEHGNRSNVWEQAEVAAKNSDDTFKMIPIAAAECYFVPDRNPELKDDRNFHLIVIAQDMEGFYELNSMLSEANVSGFYRRARVDYELLSQLDYRHFLCTTACVAGPVRDEKAEQICIQLKNIFRENFYLEVQHHPQQIQKAHNEKVLTLYRKLNIPLIYATDSHYIRHEDAELRKEQLRSAGIDNHYEDEFDLFLPTAQEAYDMMMAQGVLNRAQIQEAMENTLRLREFEGVSFTRERKFPISRPDLTPEQRAMLYQRMVCDGYIAKAGKPTPKEAQELRAEMNTILETDSYDYFIGLHDMIQKGIENGGILTTTSRGSACGFATNYALGFTSINRLHTPVKLYPERFISAAKLKSGSMPDIDSNISNVEAFEAAGREIFGEHSCYPMIAFGKTKVLSAFKLLARARDLDFAVANEISKQLSAYELARKHALENNRDDPDYDVDDDVQITDFVSAEHISLIEDSKQYQNIVMSIAPHPCAHLVYHKDLRREIGIIRLKPKAGSKEPQYCVYIDGTTADNYGFCKSDLLRVDVVRIINEAFRLAGKPVLSVDELDRAIANDSAVWDLYAKGFTQGLNQCEREKTTQRVRQFKPRNVVELAAFIAAIRPGAKSLVDTFVAREPHSYHIPAMDSLLKLNGATGVTGQSSYLFYDEQVMTLAKAAGIDPADANALIKHIKKKHQEQVEAYRNKFVPGFIKYLKETEHVAEDLAEKTAQDVWTVILNSASYLFNASHSVAMAYDSLYGAYLKAHYPYEFYVAMLKLYTEKGRKDKISAIIREMKNYMGIHITPGSFGQDNRDWSVDKEKKTISQDLCSIKFISSNVPEDLLRLSEKHYETFVDLLRDIQMTTKINTKQIDILIRLGYFDMFGGSAKLLKICNEFLNGKNRLTKSTTKSAPARMEANRKYEQELPDESLPVYDKVNAEDEYLCLCLSFDEHEDSNMYYVEEVDDAYSVKVSLYSLQRGTVGVMRVPKGDYAKEKISKGQCIRIKDWDKRQRYQFINEKRIPIPNEYDLWVKNYTIEQQGGAA